MRRALTLVTTLALLGCPTTRDAKPASKTGPATVGQGEPVVDDSAEERAALLAERKAARARRVASWRKTLKKESAAALFGRGEESAGVQNWKEAAEAYTAFLVHHTADERAPKAALGAMRARFANGQYTEGLQVAEAGVDLLEDPLRRARLQRVVGNAYLAIPHWGTEAGDRFLRGQWAQGKQTHTFRRDRRRAVEHLEAARATLAELYAAGKVKLDERADVQVDLVTAVARYTPYDANWSHWWYAWAESADDDKVAEQGEDERAGRWSWSWYDQLAQVRPRGLPVDEKGKVIFTERPARYDPALDATSKIKFLLHEVRGLDPTGARERAAEALLLQGLLFRARDGVERLQRLSSWWYRGSRPFQKEVEGKTLHTLKEDEALGLVATHLGVYELPDDESFAALMRRLIREYPNTKAGDRAGFLLGQFFQSRAQYDEAKAAYRAHLKAHPEGDWASSSKGALEELERPEIAFVEMGVQPAGRPAVLNVRFRNLDQVVVKSRRVDLDKLLKDFRAQHRNGRTTRGYSAQLPRPADVGWMFFHDQNNAHATYATKAGPGFESTLSPDPSGRYKDAALTSNISEPGLYVVEAFGAGSDARLARGLILVESIALIQKPTDAGTLFWAVDARTGAPKKGATVEVFEYWNTWSSNAVTHHSRSLRGKTSADGTTILKPGNQFLAIARAGDELSVTGFGYGWGRYSRTRTTDERVALVQSDRPVYRPGDEVQIKVWARKRVAGSYRPATEVRSVRVRIYSPQGEQLLDKRLEANEFGAVDLKMPLGAMAPLGAYNVNVEVDGGWARNNQAFRVEEYKAPEFTVSVESADEARLGQEVPVKIKAEYLFGGAVVDAKVRYKVYREDYRHEYVVPARWDWLYGPGYGRCYYVYDWFDWWGPYAPSPAVWYPWWGPPPEPARDLVLEGEGRIGADGVLEIQVDTAPAKRDFAETDHKYTVTAEVTDLSRRLIKGEGSVLVTRAAYFAHVELDRGWYRSGDELGVHIATQRPDGELFATKGELLVERVIYIGEAGRTVQEEEVTRLDVETRAEAPVRLTWRAPKTGQYKLSFVGKDARGQEVKASAVAWVAGPGFHGRQFRFQGLEVRTDKRTYAVGDTVQLMINTQRTGSHVLLATRAEGGHLLDHRVLHLDGRSTLVEVPVQEGDAPNFFVEALTVDDGEVLTEIREVFVPPMNTELDVEVTSDKARYGPGDEVTLRVKTTDADGTPRPAEVALSVFDSAVLYIQPEMLPAVLAHFWAQRRSHRRGGTTNLGIKYTFGDPLRHPDRLAGYALVRAQNEFAQTETDFRSRDGDLRGADRLKADVADAPADGEAQGVGGLGVRGSGPGGGGKGVAKLASAQAAATPAAEPEGRARREAKEEKSKRQVGEDEDDAAGNKAPPGESNAAAGATATKIRRNFADTAHFAPVVRAGADGTAEVTLRLPDNLTTWRVKAVGLDAATRAGEAEHSFKSTKDLLVRLQAPRFFRERDRVVLSAVVRNATKKAREVNVQLRVTEDLLVPEGAVKRVVEVPAEGDARVDFWVKVKGEGQAQVRMDVVSGALSDAKELSFPVLVHGLVKTVSKVSSIPMGTGEAERTLTLSLPEARRPELTTLHLRFSPSLAGGMLDALPYLLDYPYGCTEQTLSRFVPAVLTRKTLQQSGGLKLEDLKGATNLNPQQLTPGGKEDKARTERDHRVFDRNPVFSSARMDAMIAAGVRRLGRMQNPDGGWGWWGSDGSSLYTTAHVVDGLLDAQTADVALPNNMLGRGQGRLTQLVQARVQYVLVQEGNDWIGNEDAFAAWVMARSGQKNDKLLELLFERRRALSAYGKLYAAMAHHKVGDKKRGRILLENAEQLLKTDDENETAWLETQQQGWWYWWNNDVETNATWLRALDEMGRGDKRREGLARGVVKWLLNNRHNGYYWRSTRDTARVIAAFANHMQVSGERAPDMDVEVLLDGELIKTVHIDRKNLLTFDGEIVLEGDALKTGERKLTFRRKGKGALYMNAYLSYFSTEEDVEGAGLEIKVERKYYKLVRDDRVRKGQGDRGQAVRARQVAYRKVPLKTGAQVASGDLILVELMLESKNDYTFLAFEDPKPAGMEPVALRSGTTYGEAVANMELRDERVVFFLRRLDRGKRKLTYRLRAEIPGEFHTMPTFGFGMYAPELRATSDEMRFRVTEAED